MKYVNWRVASSPSHENLWNFQLENQMIVRMCSQQLTFSLYPVEEMTHFACMLCWHYPPPNCFSFAQSKQNNLAIIDGTRLYIRHISTATNSCERTESGPNVCMKMADWFMIHHEIIIKAAWMKSSLLYWTCNISCNRTILKKKMFLVYSRLFLLTKKSLDRQTRRITKVSLNVRNGCTVVVDREYAWIREPQPSISLSVLA